jgi:hypothetical protein
MASGFFQSLAKIRRGSWELILVDFHSTDLAAS